ncbi:protein CUSTOS isoform X1 [Microcaecilia unicolor]|uniref:Protein CUSTOS n=1 Tax=Microcaecilia unicolor TaxID=1415580 RepID=A0A6P7ZC38_9AMPH|nr:protein CUSTOS isoform X1 [Microcaecilia unicolor]
MAASDSESSEDLGPFREAVWEPPGSRRSLNGNKKESSLPVTYPSLRLKAEDHEYNRSELKTTPAFREFVAKKLEAMIDRCILVSQNEATPAVTAVPEAQSQEAGFRLFFSSIEEDCGRAADVPSQKQNAPSSSSEEDSEDEWQRCREVAVSFKDILKQSHLPVMHLEASQVKGQETGDKNVRLKKKYKKKRGKTEAGEKRHKTTWCVNSMSHPASSKGRRNKRAKDSEHPSV